MCQALATHRPAGKRRGRETSPLSVQNLVVQGIASQVFEGSLIRFSCKFTRCHSKTRSFIKISTPVFTIVSQGCRPITHCLSGTCRPANNPATCSWIDRFWAVTWSPRPASSTPSMSQCPGGVGERGVGPPWV